VHQSPTSPYAPSVTDKPKLLDQVRAKCRLQHLAKRTEEAYVGWIRKFILFHHKRHPLEMGVSEVEVYLTHLAVEQHVAASTQNQALCALLFLYRHVLGKPLPPVDALRAKRSSRMPVVLSRDEVRAVLAHVDRDPLSLMVELLGHADVSTTQIYTFVLQRGACGVLSPLDRW